MAVSWRIRFLQKQFAETPIFIVFWGCANFGPSCQKREILDTHPKKGKFWLITEKAHFSVFFLIFLAFCSFLFFLFFKGQVRWPEGPPHLALNPPYLFLFCFCFVFFWGVFCCFFGGFKGQVRWPEGPPHLALNPPSFVFFVCFLLVFFFFLVHFLSLFLIEKPCFPPQNKGIFCFFSVFSFLLPSLFLPPPFSVSLSLSLCFSFLLPSFLSFFFASFLFLVLVSFFLFLSSVLLFLEKNNIKIFN